jgi:hypothetical protein
MGRPVVTSPNISTPFHCEAREKAADTRRAPSERGRPKRIEHGDQRNEVDAALRVSRKAGEKCRLRARLKTGTL